MKVVVTGPVDAGKTTFIRSLSESPPVTTEQRVRESSETSTTTVGLDFGQTTVEERSIKLFGTPGQERFGYMREILAFGADGIVLLIPGDRENVLMKARKLVGPLVSSTSPPVVVGITRTDIENSEVAEETQRTFGSQALEIARIDARERDHCRRLLLPLVDRA